MGSKSWHASSRPSQRFCIRIIGVKLIVRVVLLRVVEHHIFLDFQHVGEALRALFNLTGDQRLYVDGAAILQLLNFGEIFLSIGFFPFRPYAGIDGDKLTSSHL